jgi:membrane protease subunit HflC
MCFFTVDTAEYAVVTQFGRPVQVVTEPGLGVKLPYQSVSKFDNRLFVHTPPLSEFLTPKDRGRASGVIRGGSPGRKFFETVFDRVGAETRLSDILSAELARRSGEPARGLRRDRTRRVSRGRPRRGDRNLA